MSLDVRCTPPPDVVPGLFIEGRHVTELECFGPVSRSRWSKPDPLRAAVLRDLCHSSMACRMASK